MLADSAGTRFGYILTHSGGMVSILVNFDRLKTCKKCAAGGGGRIVFCLAHYTDKARAGQLFRG